ncbi:16S rRNA (cytosine(967)-C(5))-methyltransferase RsmB [Chengkuizengella axinellae]|uniref:16S rRNA (cytosine(967)-C(5))-methyltransferase n=1 Tax=Chengkuizengella axinellae TaxID=3064388 RepID=A0ABT9IVI5_9BACL|nr:16S rRNA (cytosine(967)-C(5))-methyltransferase RsmB [Chengkuizengella sp. 2205SS18-9]MDP5273366.1 16S rRNA (cytosine(967)-C(5))-methyltransferase RsmB [Chengkuizengella sp. 2205SS18-9]
MTSTNTSKTKKKIPTARELAMNILTKVDEKKAYSNILLNESLNKFQLERQEVSLTTEIVYGTIQRMNTIDYFLNQFVSKKVNKLQPWVRSLLRLSFYQLYYLDRIPDHAVVNEAVNIAKRKGHRGISGMVNAVLRNIIRKKEQLVLPDSSNKVRYISLKHSHPEWMVKRWIQQFGQEVAEQICEANNGAPHVSVRVNQMKMDRDTVIHEMENEDLQVALSSLSQDGIVVESGGNMAHSHWFKEGKISIQDESSMLVAAILDPKPNETILDCCAAPGGKTTHIAEKMRSSGTIWANDIHPHKQKLIDEQSDRLQLKNINTTIHDALDLNKKFEKHTFDRVLLDAPCSGLGVIRRKPDLKWVKSEADVKEISKIQLDILSRVADLLKPGGILVYSTCTIESSENENIIHDFLQENPEFTIDSSTSQLLPHHVYDRVKVEDGLIQVLPQFFHSDGFFIARLQKKENV